MDYRETAILSYCGFSIIKQLTKIFISKTIELMNQICIKCDLTKPLCEFTKSKTSSNGYRNTCKLCTNLFKNNEKYKGYQKEYRIKNNLSKLRYMTEYNSKPENKERVKNWGIVNKERITKKQKEYKKTIPHVISWRNLLSHTINRLGQKKQDSTHKLLGYSAIELKEYITSLFTIGMTWDNYGECHIDHIKPVSSFSKNTHPSIVNSLSNLQPLWATTREIDGIIYEGNLNKNKKITTN